MFRFLRLICCASSSLSVAAQIAAPSITASAATANSIVPSLTMNATVQRTVGTKQESGALVIILASDGSFTEQWDLPDQKQTFQTGTPEVGRVCTKTDATGITTPVTTASCFQSVPWFAPWTGTLFQAAGLLTVSASNALNPPSALSLATAVSMIPAAASTQAIYQLAIPLEFQSNEAVLKQAQTVVSASTTTITSDGSTGLPSQATYLEPGLLSQPIRDTLMYSDYSTEGTFMMPHHITRAVQGTILYDIHVSSVTLN